MIQSNACVSLNILLLSSNVFHTCNSIPNSSVLYHCFWFNHFFHHLKYFFCFETYDSSQSCLIWLITWTLLKKFMESQWRKRIWKRWKVGGFCCSVAFWWPQLKVCVIITLYNHLLQWTDTFSVCLISIRHWIKAQKMSGIHMWSKNGLKFFVN